MVRAAKSTNSQYLAFKTGGEYRDILMKYLHYFTDDKIEIRWWKVNDECDY